MKQVMRLLCSVILLVLVLFSSAPVIRAAQTGYHEAYLCGYPDGTIRPDSPLTREALAQVLYRMIDADYRSSLEPADTFFTDVPACRWSCRAIAVLARLNILPGQPDGRFCPEQGVTGQMLALTLSRIAALEAGQSAFPELAQSWQQQNVSFEDGCGWVMGLNDGVFSPDEPLSRGQFARIFNALLSRTPENLDDLMIGMPLFSDNLDTNGAYFLDIQEAATGHSYCMDADHEVWTALG